MVLEPDLQRTLGEPDLAWLIARVRTRLERGDPIHGKATATLRHATRTQREAIDRLLGRPPTRGDTLTVRLADIDRVIRHARLADGLADAVVALTGPVANERERTAALTRRWDEMFTSTAARLGEIASPQHEDALAEWLDAIRHTGLLRRLSGNDPDTAGRLLDHCITLIGHLPADGRSIAELAASVTGNSHALDTGAPLGTLAVRAAAAIGGTSAWAGAEARRHAWASVGVACDELSAPVLALNLRGDPSTPAGRALLVHAETGEPYRLSIRQLLRQPGCVAAPPRVWVCENPSVVAAATNRLGADCPPLVCVEGYPSTASRLLVDQLAQGGAAISYHGDFDWAGLIIANLMLRRYGGRAWRMSTDDYRDAPGGVPLSGRSVDAEWDHDLRPAMELRGRAVHSEQILDTLLDDLAGQRQSRPEPMRGGGNADPSAAGQGTILGINW